MEKFSKEELSWCLYDWGNSAYTLTIIATILPMYFKLVAENGGMSSATSTAYWAYAISFSTLLISLLAPILGTIADYKGNKKKLFRLFASCGVLGTLALMIVPSNSPFLLLITNGMTVIGYAGANIFYDAFLVDVTTRDRMDKVSAMGFGLGYIGSTIPFILSIIVVFLSQAKIINISLDLACKISFLITAVWWGVFTIPLLKNVEQKFFIERESRTIYNSFSRLTKTFKDIKSHKKIFIFLVAYFFYIDGVGTIIGMATSYGTDIGISMSALLIILLLTQFIAFPFTILYGKLAEKYGTKKMLFIGIITYTIICIYAYFIKTALDFWILAMAVGSAQGGIQAISRSYFAKIVPKEKSNEFFGFYNIFGKFAAIMGPFIVGIVTQLTGESKNGVISLVLLFLIGGFLLSKVKDE